MDNFPLWTATLRNDYKIKVLYLSEETGVSYFPLYPTTLPIKYYGQWLNIFILNCSSPKAIGKKTFNY